MSQAEGIGIVAQNFFGGLFMINRVVEQSKTRKNFYRDYYRKAVSVLVGVLFLQVIVLAATMYVFLHRTVPQFYSSSSDGDLTKLTALSAPNNSNNPLIE